MSFLELAKARYTTKKYNPETKISEEKIAELKEILRLSPSSINSQPWKLFFVSDEIEKNKLAKASMFNEAKINDASHLVVFTVIDDLEIFEKQINGHLPERQVVYYNQHIKPKPEAEIKAWMQHQVYLALGFFLAACAEMGIDATPMEGIEPEAYDKILELKGYKTLFSVAIGYRDQEDVNQPSITPKLRLDLEKVVKGS